MPAGHRRNLKNLRPKNRNSPFAALFQIKGLFEANWRHLAQIEVNYYSNLILGLFKKTVGQNGTKKTKK